MQAEYIDASAMMATLMETALARPGAPAVRIHRGDPDADEVVRRAGNAEVILNGHTVMDAALLDQLPHLRRVVFLGTGAGSYVDLDAAAARGIDVRTIRGYGDRAVAEMALALIFDAARQVSAMDRDLRRGAWDPVEGLELRGRRLGLIGFGGIARELAGMALALGMEPLIFNRSPVPAPWDAMQRPLGEVLAGADIVSLHLALVPETRGFLDAGRIAQMRPGTILVNTARGALLDEPALIAALAGGHIAHAGLDVFATEPLRPDDPLRSAPNVTLTAHAGFKTREAAEALIASALALVT